MNGMEDLFPNDCDKEGFLFYPVESVVLLEKEFKDSAIENKSEIFIFVDYLQKSWWYGCKVKGDQTYSIGIIPDADTFKPISSNLSDFIKLYMEDAEIIYDYHQ